MGSQFEGRIRHGRAGAVAGTAVWTGVHGSSLLQTGGKVSENQIEAGMDNNPQRLPRLTQLHQADPNPRGRNLIEMSSSKSSLSRGPSIQTHKLLGDSSILPTAQ